MFNAIIQWSLHHRWIVMLLGLLIMGYGVITAGHIPVDVFPDFAPTQVVIQTEAPGYAPQDVENTITIPLESTLAGTPSVNAVRSLSTTGLSVITLTFEDELDVFKARQLVSEKLQLVRGNLPPGVRQPYMKPLTTAVGDIMKIGLVPQKETSLMELRTLADWTIRQRLLATTGVSNVVIYGGEKKQYQVLADPTKLQSYGLSLDALVHAVRESNTNATGGILRTPDREYLIRGLGRVQSLEDIEQTVIATRQGVPILVNQVAHVQLGPEQKVGDALVNGKPGIILNISKQPWANTLELTHRIEGAMAEMQAGFPNDVDVITVFRQADFIDVAIHHVLEALILGGILVAVVLFVFLQSWRTAFISLTAIPLSLLAAIIALKWQGGTINTMTLGGLAIAIGEVVDDAIIDVENVYRRLKENQSAKTPHNPLQVVLEASKEIRGSVVYATFIIALVFLPILSLGGMEGRIFQPLGFSFLVAIIASLAVALTVTPTLCYFLLAHQKKLPDTETKLLQWLKNGYTQLLTFALTRARTVIISALLLFMVSLVPLLFMGRTFLPEFDESNLIVGVTSTPGTSLDITAKTGEVLTRHFYDHDEIMSVGQRVGRASGSDDYGVSNFGEFDIRLNTGGKSRHALMTHLREDFTQVPGIVINMGSYISHRMDHVLSGVNAAIAVKVFGSDLTILRQKALEIETLFKQIPGAVDVQTEPLLPIPQISLHLDRQKASQYGLTVGHLSQSVETAFKGTVVSKVLEGQQSFDLVVWFEPAFRNDLDVIRSTLIDTPSGFKVPIDSVAEVTLDTTPNTIHRDNVSRRVVIQANVSDRDLGSVVQALQHKVSQHVELPKGYYVSYGGQFEAQQQATKKLLFLGGIVILGIYILLVMAFRSLRSAGLVMANLPLALIGGIWAIVLSGGVMSVGSLVGFITLFGISTRNGIMLVTHFKHLLSTGLPFDEALQQSALNRLSPVLMTALTAGFGVLPIALLGGAGRELEQPLAIVILGGMISSTCLTLIVIPALFRLFGQHLQHSKNV